MNSLAFDPGVNRVYEGSHRIGGAGAVGDCRSNRIDGISTVGVRRNTDSVSTESSMCTSGNATLIILLGKPKFFDGFKMLYSGGYLSDFTGIECKDVVA